jgi:hypothetical protein
MNENRVIKVLPPPRRCRVGKRSLSHSALVLALVRKVSQQSSTHVLSVPTQIDFRDVIHLLCEEERTQYHGVAISCHVTLLNGVSVVSCFHDGSLSNAAKYLESIVRSHFTTEAMGTTSCGSILHQTIFVRLGRWRKCSAEFGRRIDTLSLLH